MEFDFTALTLLRENTILDPISYHKVKKARRLALECQRVINLKERCDIAVDFSQANQLEAELRFEVWKNKVREYWSKYYSRTYELEEIALDLLYQQEKKSAKTM